VNITPLLTWSLHADLAAKTAHQVIADSNISVIGRYRFRATTGAGICRFGPWPVGPDRRIPGWQLSIMARNTAAHRVATDGQFCRSFR